MPAHYEVELTHDAEKSLADIADGRQQKTIVGKMEYLQENPVAGGKPLAGPLSEYMSIRAGKYRIIYDVDQEERKVIVYLVGRRRAGDRTDIYTLAKKLLKAKLL